MAASEVRVRRIVDYLNDGEELGVEGAVGAPPCSPAAPAARLSLPRFRWPRLSRLGRKSGGGKEKVVVEEEEEEIVAEKSEQEQASVAVSTSVQQEVRQCEPATTSGTRNADLGVGLSLVFLLAKTSDEFNKMVKVRAEMEALLKEMKHQVRETSGGNGHGVPELRNPESTTSSCVTDGNDKSASAHRQDQPASPGMLAARCEKPLEDDESCAETDVLEDEFHAELERLQGTYGSDIPLFVAEEDDLESEPSDDLDDYQHEDHDELGEVVEDEEDIDGDDVTEYNGVSAVELERRLHELLHERNRERIEELEAALRRAEKKLAEKDMEVCLWKDTAKFALRQENELQ